MESAERPSAVDVLRLGERLILVDAGISKRRYRRALLLEGVNDERLYLSLRATLP